MSSAITLPMGHPIGAACDLANMQHRRTSGRIRARTDSFLHYPLFMAARLASRRVSAISLARIEAALPERDMAIVRDIATWRLMSAGQIQRVHFPDSRHASAHTAQRTCRRVLERLTEQRIIARLKRRIGGVRQGSTGFIYALGPVGHRLLHRSSPRPRFREPGEWFVDHTVAVSELAVNLRVAYMHGGIESLRLEAEPTCWRSLAAYGREVLRPDAYAVVGIGGDELHSFVEVDRGSESLPRLLRKCDQYAAYYQSGVEQARSGVFPQVVWLMDDDARIAKLTAAIEKRSDLPTPLFVVASDSEALRILSGNERTNEKEVQ